MMTISIFFQTFLLSFLPPQTSIFNTTLGSSPATIALAEPGPPSLDASGVAVGKVNHPNDFSKNDYRIKTIVIDAGHGGHDPGCLGSNSQEKHIALAVSKRLASSIQEQYPEVKVILTRDKDVFIPLHERAHIANRNSADLFISIHCNFFPNRESISGSETYVMGLHTAEHNLEVAKRENSVILLEDNYEKNYDYDPNSPEGHIMLSMYQNAYLEHSILFAEKIEARIKADAKRRSRGVKQAGFVVLKETAMPSVLVETGFLSNENEERYLLTPEGQQGIADAIVAAFGEYKRSVEVLAGLEGKPPLAQIEMPAVKVEPNANGLMGGQVNNPPSAPSPPSPTPVMAAAASGNDDPQEIKTTFSSQGAPLPDREKAAGVPSEKVAATPPNSNNPPLSVYVSQDKPSAPAAASQPPATAVKTAAVTSSTLGTAVPPTSSSFVPPPFNNQPQDQQQQQQPEQPSSFGTTLAASNPAAAAEPVKVFFCVQLAASPEPLETTLDNKWQNIPYPVELLQEDGMFKYQARQFDNLQEAAKARSSLKELGFFDAFVVAYKGEKRISIAEAKKELGQ